MRVATIAVGLLLGVGLGATCAGCFLDGQCPSARPDDAFDATYAAAVGHELSIGEAPVDRDSEMRVVVDATAGRVVVRFVSEGRDVEQTYDVVATEETWF